VDAIEYYDWEAFASPEGPAVGLATYAQGKRIARLAMKARRDQEVVATLVHEAAHLSGISQIGTMFSDEIATAVEARFRQDCRTTLGNRLQQTTNQYSAKRIVEFPSVFEVSIEASGR
jgi:hypothetical protein